MAAACWGRSVKGRYGATQSAVTLASAQEKSRSGQIGWATSVHELGAAVPSWVGVAVEAGVRVEVEIGVGTRGELYRLGVGLSLRSAVR